MNEGLFILHNNVDSLGRADVTLCHAKGKIAENTVYACALLSAQADTHVTKGKKGTISRMSDQANCITNNFYHNSMQNAAPQVTAPQCGSWYR